MIDGDEKMADLYREMEVLDWFRTRPGQHTLGEIVDGPERVGQSELWLEEFDGDRQAIANKVITLVVGLAAHSINLRWTEDEFDGKYRWVDCPGCGSLLNGDCDPECEYGQCPGVNCNFEGNMGEHIEDQGSSSGYTGAPIYWINFACGHQEWDASADNAEAAR